MPTGVAVFPREITPPIRRFAEQSDNIVRWTEFGRGGHFAAMEVPDLLIGEGAVIERAIVDKECRIGRNVQIVNKKGARDDEGDNYVIRDGIVTIPRGTVIPDGTVI